MHFKTFVVLQEKWEMDIPSSEAKEKIWKVAQQRYKWWRSAFSATYKAYDNYDHRMKHKPEDLDIVEWHYLIMYFGTKEFKVWHYLINLRNLW